MEIIPEDFLHGEQLFEEWQKAVDLLTEVLHLPVAYVNRALPPNLEILRASRTKPNPFSAGLKAPMNTHFCGYVMQNKQSLVLPDARQQEDWCMAPEIEAGLVAYMGFPLLWPSEEVFGTLCVLDDKENAFPETSRRLLLQFKRLLERDLAGLFHQREQARLLTDLRRLRALLPLCARCGSPRDDAAYWRDVREYLAQLSSGAYTSGLCPECQSKG